MNGQIKLPYLCVRAVVIYPGNSQTLMVGRPESLTAVTAAQESFCNEMVVVSQRFAEQESPSESDLYRVGTMCEIGAMIRLRDGGMQVHVEGQYPFEICSFTREKNLNCALGIRAPGAEPGLVITEDLRRQALSTLKAVCSEDLWYQRLVQSQDARDFLEMARLLLPAPEVMLNPISGSPFKDLSGEECRALNFKMAMQQSLLEAPSFLAQVELIARLAREETECC